jgi:arginase
MRRTLSVIGAPSSAGAYAPGQEKAPMALRRHGLVASLAASGRRVDDQGDLPLFRWRPDPARPKAMNLDAVCRTAAAVAHQVADSMGRDSAALILGGDCTIELGTVAGALRADESVALVYIDLDVDLHTPETSDGALDWTGVAHLLDLPGAATELAGLGPRRPMLRAQDILFFGANNITPLEQQRMNSLQLGHIPLAAIQADPLGTARQAVAWAAKHRQLVIHLDVDVLEFTGFPIAENVRRADGLSFEALSQALATLTAAPNWRALTLTEVNPDHAPDEAETFRRLIGMLSAAMA